MAEMPAGKFRSWAVSSWELLLGMCFLLLCLRFLWCAFWAPYPYSAAWTTLVLMAGAAFLGAWNHRAGAFAVLAAVPLAHGLGYVGLDDIASPLCLLFAALYVGWAMHRFLQWILPLLPWLHPRDDTAAWQDHARFNPLGFSTVAGRSALVADLLISVVLASLVIQGIDHEALAGFWPRLFRQAVFGYGDPLYFVTSAFVWLAGLFFFRTFLLPQEVVSEWVRPVLFVYGFTLAVFMLVQTNLGVPAPVLSYSPWTSVISPLEDIHSFGGFAVTALIFFLATFRRSPWPRAAAMAFWVAGLLGLVIVSWSRATWLAGTFGLLLIAWFRFRKRWTLLSLALLVVAIVGLNLSANHARWSKDAYAGRLLSLVRWQNPEDKVLSRIHLYEKAEAMIRRQPWVGHGIGSFYLTSVHYAHSGDPHAATPNFAHNFLLQVAAELGIPVTLLFAGLIGAALLRGYTPWSAANGEFSRGIEVTATSGQPTRPRRRIVHRRNAATLEILGITLTLAVYLVTQMSANAVNIYLTNQFLFWFLMAALLTAGGQAEAVASSGSPRMGQ